MNNSIRVLLTISVAIGITLTTASTVQAGSASEMVQITGNVANDNAGYKVASGDLNGDGYDEVIIGAPYADIDGVEKGAIYIVYGSSDPLTNLSLDSDQVVTYYGEGQYDWAGIGIAANGDLNDDGYDDLLVGATQNTVEADDYFGAAYIIYGQANALTGGNLGDTVKLSGTGFHEFAGYAVNYIGDVNGDGYEDMGVGAPAYTGDLSAKGEVYVVYGKSAQYTDTTLSGAGVRIEGENAGDNLGGTLSAVGDLNNDGYDDWMVGAYGYNIDAVSDTGTVYIYYGQAEYYDAGTISAPQLQGVAGNDGLSYLVSNGGDLNSDGYDDALISNSFHNNGDDNNTGSMYILYGSDTEVTTQLVNQLPELTGENEDDYFSTGLAGGGSSGDEYADFIASAPYNDTVGENVGRVHLIDGQDSQLTSANVVDSDTGIIDGVSATEQFGYSVAWGDINGDNLSELISGAPYNDTAAADAGTVYVGYLRIDNDQDGTLNGDGIIETGNDCNDNDALVQSNQTYYVDQDGDGLGINTNPISVCSSDAPEGYTNNTDDTDDDIANNGIEIDDDGIDNDGDGDVDENNSLTDNGEHPGFGGVDPTDTDAVTAAVDDVKARSNGRIQVRFADNSVFVYRIFSGSSVGKPKIKKYPGTAYYAAILPTGNKIALVNVLNGNVVARKKIRSTVYKKHYMQFTDFRSNGVQDLVVASKRGSTVRVVVTEANFQASKFKYLDTVEITSPEAIIKNTSIVNNTIDIRSRLAALQSIFVNKKHHLHILN